MTTTEPTIPGFLESVDALHEEARKAVGNDDFGNPSYMEGFRVLARAYDREARLRPLGRTMVRAQLLGILENRLVAQRFWTERPEILEQKITRPIFILGLPRTGTTALHHLLGQDPNIQVLEYWMAASPRPRPPRETWAVDPRFRQAAAALDNMYALDPSLKAMHLMTPDGPEECRHLIQQTFTDDTFDCNSTIPSYSNWYRQHDMRDAYERHRDLLRLIGSPTPERRWVLKYPVHMRNLRAVLETYPDACFVHLHRDPARIVPSICSLVAGWRAIYEYDPDPRAIARWQMELWAAGIDHAMEVRREQDERQFFDLHFREILADPVGAIKRIYDYFGVELTEEAERRMRDWHAANPQGKHGEHSYTTDRFGLTRDAIIDRYAAYIERFRVELEHPA